MLYRLRYFVLVFIALVYLPFICCSQNVVTTKNAPKKVLDKFQKATGLSAQKEFKKASVLLDDVLKREPNFIDAIILKGGIAFDSDNYEEAESHFEKALSLNPKYNSFLYYQLGVTQWKLKKYEDCAAQMDIFLKGRIRRASTRSRAEQYKRNALFAAKAVKNPVPFKPVPLNENINSTEAEELFPFTTAEEQFLIYVKHKRGGLEDIYISQKLNGTWQVGKPLSGFSQPDLNEGAPAISADGNTLVYTVCNQRGDFGSCDLYISERMDSKRWTTPKNIGNTINSAAWESQPSLSPNGRKLYFSSNRKGGQGKLDLWMSEKDQSGKWSIPKNLGPSINTPYDEEAPFIHPDEQSLYFVSDGHPGMGDSDLFLSRRDTSFQWQAPENLGYPINNEQKERGIFISMNGKTAYFTRETNYNNDIYTFDFPENLRPQPVTFVRAVVFNANTEERLNAEVEIFDLKTQRVFTKIKTTQDGTFLACLPSGSNYALSVEKTGYTFFSENFTLEDGLKTDEPYLLRIPLIPIPEKEEIVSEADSISIVSEPIILKNIFFESGSAVLLSTSQAELNRLYQLLLDNANMQIQINGHTDDVGEEIANQLLSEQRAKAVYDYLVEKGIKAERLRYKGFGEQQPIADNATPEGKQQNRRTEFVILN